MSAQSHSPSHPLSKWKSQKPSLRMHSEASSLLCMLCCTPSQVLSWAVLEVVSYRENGICYLNIQDQGTVIPGKKGNDVTSLISLGHVFLLANHTLCLLFCWHVHTFMVHKGIRFYSKNTLTAFFLDFANLYFKDTLITYLMGGVKVCFVFPHSTASLDHSSPSQHVILGLCTWLKLGSCRCECICSEGSVIKSLW